MPFPTKSATPATAFIDVVPASVPVAPLRVIVTRAVASGPTVTTLPNESLMVSTGCGLNAAPATVGVPGCVVYTIWKAAALVTVSCCVADVTTNGLDEAAVRVGVPEAVSQYL